MNDRVHDAMAGSGGLLLLKGAEGTGKTRLLENAISAAQARGMAVESATHEAGRQTPLRLTLGALRAPGRSRSLNLLEARSLLIDQICVLIEEQLARSPVLLVVDDLQRVEPGNVLLIQRLVVRLAAYPLLWLFAVRDEEVDGLRARVLEELVEREGATSMELGPLPVRAVAEVVADLTGAPPDEALLSVVAAARGNPLGVVEIMEILREDAAVSVAGGRSSVTEQVRYETMAPLIDRRLAFLSGETRQLLEVAAVLGRSFSLHDAANVLGVPPSRLLSSIQEARRAGLVVATPTEALTFKSRLVRDTIYSALEEPIRVALHRQIGEVLLERGGAAKEAAAHLLEGARSGDHRVLAALDEAIGDATRTSPQFAATLALHALELTQPADPTRPGRTLAAVEALTAAERLEEAAELARSTLGSGTAPGVPAARLRLALSSFRLADARPEEAVWQAEIVLQEADLPIEVHAAAEAALLTGLLSEDDLGRARRFAEDILAGSEYPDSGLAMAGATMALARVAWSEGRVSSALGLARAAVSRADRHHHGGFDLHPRLALASMLSSLGEFDEADILLAQCREEIELSGDTINRAAPIIGRADVRLAAGRLEDAQTDAEAGWRLAQSLGARKFIRAAKRVLASISMFRGDLPAAFGHLESEGEDLLPAMIAQGGVVVGGQLLQVRGGAAQSVEALAGLYDDLSAYKRVLLEDPAVAAWLVRTSLTTGDRTRAKAVVVGAEQLAADNRAFPSVIAGAAQARGLLERDVVSLEVAAAAHRHPWARASALEDVGTVLAEDRDIVGAGEHFEKALAAYGQTGFDRDAAHVRARLRRIGVRRRHWSHADRPAWGWESLTETEARVAHLVTEGLTNPQVAARMYLSRHTVDFHLRQIFRKLDIGSRVELTRLALEANRLPFTSP